HQGKATRSSRSCPMQAEASRPHSRASRKRSCILMHLERGPYSFRPSFLSLNKLLATNPFVDVDVCSRSCLASVAFLSDSSESVYVEGQQASAKSFASQRTAYLKGGGRVGQV